MAHRLTYRLALTLLLALAGFASAQTWTPLTHQPGVNVGPMLQLRDGRILVHEEQAGDPTRWWVLAPSASGSYVDGMWSSAGNTAAFGYAPFYFGSQVLLDGKTVAIEGGEYNFGTAKWTTLGAQLTYSGSSFTWVQNLPPAGWSTIGDAQSVILADGRYMQANCCTTQSAVRLGHSTWGPDILSAGVDNDEGGYTLLQNGKVLMVDAWHTGCQTTNTSSELFDPISNKWSCVVPPTIGQLWDNSGHELGPAVTMHNGKVFQVGATNLTNVFDPSGPGSWSLGPTPPGGLTGYDAPGALEPNGKVLEMLGPPGFGAGCQFMEYNGATLTPLVNQPAHCPGDPSFIGHLMMLPSGQIMFTDLSGFVEVYNPGGSPEPVAVPIILASQLMYHSPSVNNLLYGSQLNGLSQNNAYGDDYQGDTDFPLVRLTCNAGNTCPAGNVYWTLTHDESTHSIAPGTIMYTKFDIPAGVPAGFYTMVSIASGVKSNPIIVRVVAP